MTATHDQDVQVLFPDVDVEVRDPDTGEPVEITVREFRFLEGLRAQARARPLIGGLSEVLGEGVEDGPDSTAAVAHVLDEHADAWIDLLARACGREVDWLARLGDADGDTLSEAMWRANGGFFMRRVVSMVVATRESEAKSSPSPQSSRSSSGGGTDADTKTSHAA